MAARADHSSVTEARHRGVGPQWHLEPLPGGWLPCSHLAFTTLPGEWGKKLYTQLPAEETKASPLSLRQRVSPDSILDSPTEVPDLNPHERTWACGGGWSWVGVQTRSIQGMELQEAGGFPRSCASLDHAVGAGVSAEAGVAAGPHGSHFLFWEQQQVCQMERSDGGAPGRGRKMKRSTVQLIAWPTWPASASASLLDIAGGRLQRVPRTRPLPGQSSRPAPILCQPPWCHWQDRSSGHGLSPGTPAPFGTWGPGAGRTPL